jgi:hypothetical protein
MAEKWKSIEGFPSYQVSNTGRVRSCVTRTNTWFGKILKTYKDKDGYLRLSLLKGTKRCPRYVHLLVAHAFVPNPDPKALVEANHKDGNRENPAASNLEWRTGLGNKRHSVKTGQNKAKGVTFSKSRGKWHAYYSPNGKKVYLGTTFRTKKEALAARKSAIEELPHVD